MRGEQAGDVRPSLGRFVGREEPAARKLCPDRVDHRSVRRVSDQGMHAGVIDDVTELRPGKPEVQRHENGAETGGGEQCLEKGGLIEPQKSHPVATTNAVRAQGAGQAVNPVLKFSVGPGRAFERKGPAVRGSQRPSIEPVAEPDIHSHGISVSRTSRLYPWPRPGLCLARITSTGGGQPTFPTRRKGRETPAGADISS